MLSPGEQRACGALRVPGGAKFAAIEAVEGGFRGEEAETALVAGDDAGGAVVNFNDIGFGHGCSFAGRPALLSNCGCVRSVAAAQRQAPVAAETQRRVMRLRISIVTGRSFGLMRHSGKAICASTIGRRAQAVNEMGIHIWMRDAAAVLHEMENAKQNDFAVSIAR